MEPITIQQHGEILAHHTETPLSHYGQDAWIIETDPEPGPALWKQGGEEVPLEILGVMGGWLICRQPDGLLCGVIWSDGTYYAEVLEDQDGRPLTELSDGAHVRGTVFFSEDPEDLGSILF